MKASSTKTSSEAGELDRLETEITADQPEPTPTPTPEPEQPAPGQRPLDVAQTLDQLGSNPDSLGKLDARDVGEMVALPFALVAVQRGDHWKLPADSEEGRLITKWVLRAIERHGWNAVAAWMPDVIGVALIVNAIARRVELDKKAKQAAPLTTESSLSSPLTRPSGPRPMP